jgi:hypothetical protein
MTFGFYALLVALSAATELAYHHLKPRGQEFFM